MTDESRHPSFRRPLPFARAALIVLIVLAIAGAGSWLWLAQDDRRAAPGQLAPAAASATPVVVARAVAANDRLQIDAVGSALAASSVTIHPAVAGEVERVLFVAGDRVKQDQLLVQLVDRRERLAVQMAQAQLDAANRLLARYKRTRGTGAVSPSVVDEAEVAQRRAEIALSQARVQLRDLAVRAPFAGTVGIPQVDPGARVTTETPITTLDDRTMLSVVFQVPEAFIGRLALGHPVTLESVAFPGRVFTGKLAHIDSRVDRVTRTVAVRAALANEQDLLRPGMSFEVGLEVAGPPVLRVPEMAAQWSREGSHVWVIRAGKSVRVPVRVVRRMEGFVLVDGEVRADELIVVEGVQRLRDGREVRIVQGGAPAAPAASPVAMERGGQDLKRQP